MLRLITFRSFVSALLTYVLVKTELDPSSPNGESGFSSRRLIGLGYDRMKDKASEFLKLILFVPFLVMPCFYRLFLTTEKSCEDRLIWCAALLSFELVSIMIL